MLLDYFWRKLLYFCVKFNYWKKFFINILVLELICMYVCLSCEMNKGNDSIVYVVINMYIIKLLIVLNVWYLFIINLYKSFLKKNIF